MKKKSDPKVKRQKVVNLIFLGRKYYIESGTRMGCLYAETWERGNPDTYSKVSALEALVVCGKGPWNE